MGLEPVEILPGSEGLLAGGAAIGPGQAFLLNALPTHRGALMREFFPLPPALAHLCLGRRPLDHKSTSCEDEQETEQSNHS
jgi:hypothetical protein